MKLPLALIPDVVPNKDSPRESLPAGGFSSWLKQTHDAQRSDSGVDVKCGECSACCRSSYFIHLRPEDEAARRRIPKELLFVAPGLPPGHSVLGFDDAGRCPMWSEDGCTIYEDRPLTCRQFDCRVFAATEISEEETREEIRVQSDRWKFDFENELASKEKAAVVAASKFLRDHAALFTPHFLPPNAPQLAMLAIRLYSFFIDAAAAQTPQALVTRIENALRRE